MALNKSIFLFLLLVFVNCMINESANDLFAEGKKFAADGNQKKAFSCFKSAAKKAPDSALYFFAAAQTAPDQNTAFMYTKFSWEKGYKNLTVFTSLLRLSFHVDKEKKFEYALSLFSELPDSIATNNLKGDLYYDFSHFNEARNIWKNEFTKTGKSFYCPKIAHAIVKLGKVDTAIAFLYKCKDDKKMDSEGYSTLISLLAMQYKYREVDRLFSDASSGNLYDDQLRLDQITYLIMNGRGSEAEQLLARSAGPSNPIVKGLINIRLHTLRIFNEVMAGQKDRALYLIANYPADTVLKGKDVTVYNAIKSFINNDSSSFTLLKNACEKLPSDPVTTIFMARAAMKTKKYKEAIEYYNHLPGLVLWAPIIVAERAQAMALTGNDDDALKVISFMHSKRIFSRQSLELFRNLTLKKDLIEKSEAAQKLLEKQYSNDIGLKWKGLLVAIKAEKIDSALTIANQLSVQYPDDDRFELTKLTLLLIKKEFRKVLEIVGKSSLPREKTKPIEAVAWKGLGDTTQAILAYEEAIKDRSEPILKMQLAEMYFQTKAYNKANMLYSELLEDSTASMFRDSLQMAVLLNNNAWTIMTAGEKDLTAASNMAKKAFDLAPGNMHILDTYISILYEAKKYKECISLLEKNTQALTQKRLLIHLSRSWEMRGDNNKAKRYLEDALQCSGDDQKLSSLLTDKEIKKEIERLSEKKN